MGRMTCTKESREKCELAYMCEENAEVADDSECADMIVKLEALKWNDWQEKQLQRHYKKMEADG